MSEFRFLPDALVTTVADREGVPALVAQDLAARASLNVALQAESGRHDRFPGRERRRNQLALLEGLLAKEDRNVGCA